MKTYQVSWVKTAGISYVQANSAKEALQKAELGEDEEYEDVYDCDDLVPSFAMEKVEED